MLDQNDLKILAGMFAASEERMMKRMDSLDNRMDSMENRMDSLDNRMDSLENRMDEMDTRLTARIDSLEVQMKKSEDLVMEELSRTQIYFGNKIEKLQKTVDRIEQYYRVDRLDGENAATLLKLYTGQRKKAGEQMALVDQPT